MASVASRQNRSRRKANRLLQFHLSPGWRSTSARARSHTGQFGQWVTPLDQPEKAVCVWGREGCVGEQADPRRGGAGVWVKCLVAG